MLQARTSESSSVSQPKSKNLDFWAPKKAETRQIIQKTALYLFKTHGYEATSIDDIVTASKISSSTFFRYFKTKPALVFEDSLDLQIAELFKQQPSHLTVVQALRNSIHQVYGELSPKQLQDEAERLEMIRTTPALRAVLFEECLYNIDSFSVLIAQRVGLSTKDKTIRVLSGAIFGALLSICLEKPKQSKTAVDWINAFEQALELLDKGISL